MGIEIEIKWSTVFPRHGQQWFGAGQTYKDFDQPTKDRFDLLDDYLSPTKLPRYQRSLACGVPKGNDAFWEFALAPANSYKTILREAEALCKAGLINLEFRHPLHLTLGGIGLNNQAMVLARALELGGGSSKERIALPAASSLSAWSCVGEAGVKQRSRSELALDTKAIEIRTLEVSSLPQLSRLLSDGYWLGMSLKAYWQDDGSELCKIWQAFSTKVGELFQESRLIPPDRFWPRPKDRPEHWLQYAHAFDSELPLKMRKLLITTRRSIKALAHKV